MPNPWPVTSKTLAGYQSVVRLPRCSGVSTGCGAEAGAVHVGSTHRFSSKVNWCLVDEVADLRDDQGYSHFTDRGPVPPGTSLSANSPAAATVFIFHDGNRISGQNYAITGQTLWIFNEHSARKFALADLDVAATEKANAANGVEFHAPGGEDRH